MRSGNSSTAPLIFDSDLDDVPERGIVSEGSMLYLELTADSSAIPLLLALRYEGEHKELMMVPLYLHKSLPTLSKTSINNSIKSICFIYKQISLS